MYCREFEGKRVARDASKLAVKERQTPAAACENRDTDSVMPTGLGGRVGARELYIRGGGG